MTEKRKQHGKEAEINKEEFQIVAMVAVNFLVRYLDNDIIHKWSKDPQGLHKSLREFFLGPLNVSIEDYNVYVDYEKSIEEGIRAGFYEHVHPNINSINFPMQRKGNGVVKINLFQFNQVISTLEVLEEISQRGYRPAEIREIIAFGEKYHQKQIESPIIAFGSFSNSKYMRDYVPVLTGTLIEGNPYRSLSLVYFDNDWPAGFRFAAVPL